MTKNEDKIREKYTFEICKVFRHKNEAKMLGMNVTSKFEKNSWLKMLQLLLQEFALVVFLFA